ncbi:MAG: ABC transporter ATP-binding protein [Chloroflexia bacterium]|nr:ABC transporter ATP-binding protein [Chloroflexia bacterium]
MVCLELCRLSKTYPGSSAQNGRRPVEALHNIDLRVREGEFLAILGPSGCGKTTLLQIVAGLEQPTAGEVRFRGRRVTTWGRERTLIFQEYTLFPWLTARGNVEFGLRLQGLPAEQRRRQALETLHWLGLDEFAEAYPHQLSGGMQQRVALARALAVDPEVLLMDEPFAAVDAITRSRLQQELRRIQQLQRRTVLLVTHSVREALLLADRIVVLTARPGRLCLELPLPQPLAPEAMLGLEERIHSSLL